MTMTGLPDYRPPIEQSLRSVCGQRFVVYLGAPSPFSERAFEAARERAEGLGTLFIDASSTPKLICHCGEVLMFDEDTAGVLK
jgi:hypothetical protein